MSNRVYSALYETTNLSSIDLEIPYMLHPHCHMDLYKYCQSEEK